MKTLRTLISFISVLILSAALSASVCAKTITEQRSVTVPKGGSESFTVEITNKDNGALIYDMTVDASEGDITVYTSEGKIRDTIHYTSEDMPVHRYMPASQGTYTVEITRTASSSGSGAVSAELTYEGDSQGCLIFDIVDSVKAVIITIVTALISVAALIFRIPFFKYYIYGGMGGGMNSYRSSYYDVRR